MITIDQVRIILQKLTSCRQLVSKIPKIAPVHMTRITDIVIGLQCDFKQHQYQMTLKVKVNVDLHSTSS